MGALMCVEPKRRVAMLCARWRVLKAIPMIVQVALLSVGPRALALVEEAIAEANDPSALLKNFTLRATTIFNGRQGLTTPEHLHNLRPFLQHLSDKEIVILYGTCEKNGWVDFRRQHLEPRMRAMQNRGFFLPGDPVDLSAIDEALNPEPGVRVNLHRWLEHSMRRGMERDAVIVELIQWLERNTQQRALKIVANIISLEGTRKEFRVFEKVAKRRLDTVALIDAVRFDVFHRRLV